MANIPVNFGGVILEEGQSATGSFAGFQVLGTESPSTIYGADITFKYGVGLNANGSVIQSSNISAIVPAGKKIELFITSASLAAASAPIILYT
jgi:hypothetical protein